MTKRKFSNILLLVLGLLCPFIFFVMMKNFSGGIVPQNLFDYLWNCYETAPILFTVPGPIGLAAMLTILIREREKLNFIIWLPLFLILLLNLTVVFLTFQVLWYDYLW